MTDQLWRFTTPHGRHFVEAFAGNPGAALLAFDFDGTLAPIVDDPEESQLHERSAAALAVLGPLVKQLAIVTGRGVGAVKRLGRLESREGLYNLVVLGQYGVERWDAASGRTRHPEVPEGIVAAWRDVRALVAELGDAGVETDGVYLEDKERAIGIHTRRAKDPQALLERLTEPVTRIAQRHDLLVEPGRFVLEIRASRQDKGDALRELVQETHPHLVAMVGDDLGDLAAFAVLEELRASGLVCARVVSGSTEQTVLQKHADITCDGPDGVAQWLEHLAGQAS